MGNAGWGEVSILQSVADTQNEIVRASGSHAAHLGRLECSNVALDNKCNSLVDMAEIKHSFACDTSDKANGILDRILLSTPPSTPPRS